MKLRRTAAIFSLIFVISACASLPKVKLPPERISQEGYSLVPLNEPGWLVLGRNKYSLALAKSGANEDESFLIQATLSEMPEYKTNADFLQIIKDGQAKDTKPQRFDILKHEVTSFPMKGVDCAQSHLVAVDHAAQRKSKRTGDMILEMLALSCAHPSDKSIAIHITYSHRHDPGQDDPAIIEKGSTVLSSVELFDPAQPYISNENKTKMLEVKNFNEACSGLIIQPASSPTGQTQDKNESPLNKLQAIGISIDRTGGSNNIGSYALFEKGENDVYSLSAIQASYMEPSDMNTQEVLYISPELDRIAPAFAVQHLRDGTTQFSEGKQAYLCSKKKEESPFRHIYNPCDSSLTSPTTYKTATLSKTLITVMTLGTDLLTKLTVDEIDTDKDKVAKLVVDSRLLQCLEDGKRDGLINRLKGTGSKRN